MVIDLNLYEPANKSNSLFSSNVWNLCKHYNDIQLVCACAMDL